MKLNDTIVAQSTPQGEGAIGIIRLSGKDSIKIINKLFPSKDLINVKSSKKHLVMGDMLELGKHTKKLHIQISKVINLSSIGSVSVFGKAAQETYKKIKNEKRGIILRETSKIFDLIVNNLNNNDYLMIKGSNSTGLNKFVKIIKRKKLNVI